MIELCSEYNSHIMNWIFGLVGDTPLAAGVWYWEIRVDKNTDEMMIGVAKYPHILTFTLKLSL